MKCTHCENEKTKVIDTRDTGEKVRRRRECKNCNKRFTTYEQPEQINTTVVKKGSENETYDEEKLRKGIEKAAKKTELTHREIEEIIDEVNSHVRGRKEIESEQIGKKVKKKLKETNEVAYIRFASVYDSFEDVESFKKEIEALTNQQ